MTMSRDQEALEHVGCYKASGRFKKARSPGAKLQRSQAQQGRQLRWRTRRTERVRRVFRAMRTPLAAFFNRPTQAETQP